eukprot:2869111-Pleurochrysis_carterae.AAC.1
MPSCPVPWFFLLRKLPAPSTCTPVHRRCLTCAAQCFWCIDFFRAQRRFVLRRSVAPPLRSTCEQMAQRRGHSTDQQRFGNCSQDHFSCRTHR